MLTEGLFGFLDFQIPTLIVLSCAGVLCFLLGRTTTLGKHPDTSGAE